MSTSLTGNKEFGPGSFEAKEIMIVGEAGEVDITMFVEEFIMTESLFMNTIRGTITWADGLNIMTNLPITEGDTVHVHYTPNQRDDIMMKVDPDELDHWFEIVKISTQRKIKQDAQLYVFQLVSSTWSENLYSRVSKSYYQKPWDLMVQEVYDEYCCKGGMKGLMPIKPLDIFPSEGLWNVVIPSWKPHKFFNWVSGRAYSGDWADWCFWEDKEQFHWAPLNYLKTKGPVAEYYPAVANIEPVEGSNNQEELEKAYFQIENYEIKHSNDIGVAALQGMIGHRLITHDIVRKKVVDYYIYGPEAPNYILDDQWTYYDDFDKTEHVDGPREKLIRPDSHDKFSIDPGNSRITLSPIHFEQWDDMPEFKPHKWLRQHESQILACQFLRMEASVVGNFTRKVGDVITIKLPTPEWKPKNSKIKRPEEDSRLTENWLIISLRRIFHKEKWHLKLELIKDNYYDFVPDHYWEPEPWDPSNGE